MKYSLQKVIIQVEFREYRVCFPFASMNETICYRLDWSFDSFLPLLRCCSTAACGNLADGVP